MSTLWWENLRSHCKPVQNKLLSELSEVGSAGILIYKRPPKFIVTPGELNVDGYMGRNLLARDS